ncbi:MAG: type II toxin-antitoxin system Phd/YefM family antitoxin [Deltaproteobacteria bacterium]|nr:type II toxin-antitoxin system Phd/YefM family antitoxin [Deltaproteobacteria bacterium]
MKTINALQLRQSLGKVVAALEKTGEPILLERGRKPVGVIVSIQDFQERFVEKSATAERKKIFDEIARLAIASRDRTPVAKILRELRDSD